METNEVLKWLKDNNLYGLCEESAQVLKKVFTPCLGVQDERILIVGDTGSVGKNVAAILSGAYYLASQELKLDAKLIFQDTKSKGEDAEQHVIDGLSEIKENNILMLNLSDKLGRLGDLGKSFRKWSQKKGHRFSSALSLRDLSNDSIRKIIDAIDINYKPMQQDIDKLKSIFDKANEIRVSTDIGTDLYYNVKGSNSIGVDGNYTEYGTGGNLPSGEVYIAPNGKKVEGKVVIDASSRNYNKTLQVKKPFTIHIEQGSIVDIEGGNEANELKKSLKTAENISKYPGSIRRVGEFGIGLNPKAEVIGSMVVDDKVKNTAHIGIGSNYWFGGSIYAIIHLDQVFYNPKIEIDGEEVKV